MVDGAGGENLDFPASTGEPGGDLPDDGLGPSDDLVAEAGGTKAARPGTAGDRSSRGRDCGVRPGH